MRGMMPAPATEMTTTRKAHPNAETPSQRAGNQGRTGASGVSATAGTQATPARILVFPMPSRCQDGRCCEGGNEPSQGGEGARAARRQRG